MAVRSYMICRTCKQYTCLGKWVRGDDRVGFGFWRGGQTYEELRLKTLNFPAVHTRHEITMLTDHEFFAESIGHYVSVEEDLLTNWPERAN